jgi:DNA-binding CsgD family transcriptional regulator
MSMRATLYPELAERTKGLGRRGQVLAGIWAGKGTKEIGAELGLSPKTVEYHRAQLYRVFGVSDLVSLCRRAIAVGLINPKGELGSPTEEGRRKGTSRKRRAKETMPEAMRHACHSESESESDKRQV